MFRSVFEFFNDVFFLEQNREFLPIFQEVGDHYKKERDEWYLDVVYVGVEYTANMEEFLREIKYHREISRITLMYPIMQHLGQVIPQEWDYITYPPMRFLDFWKRSYNHVKILAWYFAKATKHAKPIQFLVKIRNTKHQAILNRKERLINPLGAYDLRRKFRGEKTCMESLQGKTILFIDDVISSGSTANECAKILKSYGASKVIGVFLTSWIQDITMEIKKES